MYERNDFKQTNGYQYVFIILNISQNVETFHSQNMEASLHNVLFVQYDGPVVFWLQPIRNTMFGTLKIGQNDLKIPNLEFESLGFLEIQVFLPTKQAGTNIC